MLYTVFVAGVCAVFSFSQVDDGAQAVLMSAPIHATPKPLVNSILHIAVNYQIV